MNSRSQRRVSLPGEVLTTFRFRKRAIENWERQVETVRVRDQSQSVMARQRARCSAGRHNHRLTTIAGFVLGFIGCALLVVIVSSPCVQAVDDSRVLNVNYYNTIRSDEDVRFGSSDGANEEFDFAKVREEDHEEEVQRTKSGGGASAGDSAKMSINNVANGVHRDDDEEEGDNVDHDDPDDDQLVVQASTKSARTVQQQSQRFFGGSENVILPKFGDRISPRKQHHSSSSSPPATTLVVGHQSDYYAETAASGGNTFNGREGRSGVVIPVISTSSSSASAATNPISSRHTTNPISDSVANSNVIGQQHSGDKAMPSISEDLNLNEVDALPAVLLNENQVNNQNVSSAQAHRLEMSTEFFVVPSLSTPLPLRTKSTTRRPNGGMLVLAKDGKRTTYATNRGEATPPTITIVAASSAPSSGLRKEPWVVPVLVLATLSMFMMAAFEVFVLCKAWRTSPSRRHLFLGQMLLLGLFSCAGLAAILTATPTLLSCATVRFGAGVAFALVFASLLVKCVFLISLNGGVYLPAPYQGLLLLFAVLIQIAVGSQWLLTSPPAVDTVTAASPSSHSIFINRNASLLLPSSSLVSSNSQHHQAGKNNATGQQPQLDVTSFSVPTIALCRTQFSELLLSLIYVVFLILFVAMLAIKSRGIRDNYREATYIGLAIGGSIPIWLGWTLCGLAVAERHRDACLAFGLIATSTTVFLVMFMPKGRQLAAMGKEGLYVEDREERFSSLSRAGSGYSPSFFHFKPIKYGVMGGNSPSNTNTGVGLSNNLVGSNVNNSNNNNNNHISSSNGNSCNSMTKHQAVATLGGGEFSKIMGGSCLSFHFRNCLGSGLHCTALSLFPSIILFVLDNYDHNTRISRVN